VAGGWKSAAEPFFADLGRLSGGTAAGHIVIIAVSPVLTRFITPADMGVFGVFSAYVAVLSVLVSFGYDMAIAAAPSRGEALRLLTGTLVLTTCGALLFGTGLQLAAAVAGEELLPLWMPAGVAVAVIAANATSALQFWYIREGNFSRVGLSNLAGTGGRGLAHLASAVLFGSALALAVADIVGRVIGLLSLRAGIVLQLVARSGRKRFRACWTTLSKRRGFPLYQTPAAVVDVVLIWLPTPAVAFLYGAEMAGQFAILQRVMSAPSALIGRGLSDVFHQRAGRIQSHPAKLMRLTLSVLGLIALLFAPVWLVLLVFGRSLFELVFGPQWGMAGSMAELMAPLIGLQVAASVVTRLLMVVHRQGYKLAFAVVSVAAYVAVFLAAKVLEWDVLTAVLALVLSGVLIHGCWFALVLWWLRGRTFSRA
jgi:O-antigen/teichoic acid export membrane protein